MFNVAENFENVAVLKPWDANVSSKESAVRSYAHIPERPIFVVASTGNARKIWGLPLNVTKVARTVADMTVEFGLQHKAFELMASDLIMIFEENARIPRLDAMEILLIENNLNEGDSAYSEAGLALPRQSGALIYS